jgi:hypothetical protein
MHLNTQQMRALKATIWLTIPVTNWEEFTSWQKRNALCKDCVAKIADEQGATLEIDDDVRL